MNSQFLTMPEKRAAMKAWNAEVPELAPYRTKDLVKRVGPLLLKLKFEHKDRGFKAYQLEYTAHCICQPANFIAKTLGYYHSLGREGEVFDGRNINYFDHKDHLEPEFKEIADYWRQHVWIPLEGEITMDDIFQGYKNYAESGVVGSIALFDVEGLVYTAAWAGLPDKAREHLDWVEFMVKKHCESIHRAGGRERWKERIEYYIDRPELLRKFHRAIVKGSGLGDVPYQEIKDAPYKEVALYDEAKDPFVEPREE